MKKRSQKSQNSQNSDPVREDIRHLGVIIEDVQRQVYLLAEGQTAMRETLDEHSQSFIEIRQTLDEHSRILSHHSQTLDEHSKDLKEIRHDLLPAEVAELVDALRSGRSPRKGMEVRVLSSANSREFIDLHE